MECQYFWDGFIEESRGSPPMRTASIILPEIQLFCCPGALVPGARRLRLSCVKKYSLQYHVKPITNQWQPSYWLLCILLILMNNTPHYPLYFTHFRLLIGWLQRCITVARKIYSSCVQCKAAWVVWSGMINTWILSSCSPLLFPERAGQHNTISRRQNYFFFIFWESNGVGPLSFLKFGYDSRWGDRRGPCVRSWHTVITYKVTIKFGLHFWSCPHQFSG